MLLLLNLLAKIKCSTFCKCACPHAACRRKGVVSCQDGSSEELVLFFCPMGLGNRTQVTGLVPSVLTPWPISPDWRFFLKHRRAELSLKPFLRAVITPCCKETPQKTNVMGLEYLPLLTATLARGDLFLCWELTASWPAWTGPPCDKWIKYQGSFPRELSTATYTQYCRIHYLVESLFSVVDTLTLWQMISNVEVAWDHEIGAAEDCPAL